MSWDKFAICKNCGYYYNSIGDHANAFSKPCDKCGEIYWDTMVIAKEIFNGKWWNPLTWFNNKLERKQPPNPTKRSDDL